ncbi:hypothetical protein [Neobacillus sp. FSL H8-0543]|uniref:hypothetical protein n=1 Tax=Neobacillus sp. FSL H8-0543 TaxID=2954672 RepID=UPI0031597530
MKGIYFINDRISLNGLSKEESIAYQKQTILEHNQINKIQVAKPNLYQLHEYYTNLHALLYDLKKEKQELDCFVIFSSQIIEDYIYTYPARWLILKSFFKEIITVAEQPDLQVKKVV